MKRGIFLIAFLSILFNAYIAVSFGNIGVFYEGELSITNLDVMPPEVTIISPTATTYTSSNIFFEVMTNDNATCNYTLNNGVTNQSMTANDSDTGFTASQALSNAAYVVNFYCFDVLFNLNNTESVSFTVSVPEEGGGAAPSGGGAAAPTGDEIYDFKINPSFLEIELKKGSYYQKYITLSNNGTKDLVINASVSNLEEFIFLEDNIITLNKGQNKTVLFTIYASESKKADVYLGKINFNSTYVERAINVVLDIKDKASLFDIQTTVLKKYILPGKDVTAQISIVNLGELKNITVELEYSIIDFENKIHESQTEKFVIDEFFNESRFIKTPKDANMGPYIFYTKISYKGTSASSYDSFFIEKLSMIMWFIIVLIIILMIILLVMILIKKHNKILKPSKVKNK